MWGTVYIHKELPVSKNGIDWISFPTDHAIIPVGNHRLPATFSVQEINPPFSFIKPTVSFSFSFKEQQNY